MCNIGGLSALFGGSKKSQAAVAPITSTPASAPVPTAVGQETTSAAAKQSALKQRRAGLASTIKTRGALSGTLAGSSQKKTLLGE